MVPRGERLPVSRTGSPAGRDHQAVRQANGYAGLAGPEQRRVGLLHLAQCQRWCLATDRGRLPEPAALYGPGARGWKTIRLSCESAQRYESVGLERSGSNSLADMIGNLTDRRGSCRGRVDTE